MTARLLLLSLFALLLACPADDDDDSGAASDDDDSTVADDDDATGDDDDSTTGDDDDSTAGDDDDSTAGDDDDATGDDDDSTAPPTPDVVVSVDRGTAQGPLTPLLGVNRTPVIDSLQGDFFDFTALYQWAGVTSVRAHDQGYDLCRVYTDDALVRSSNGEVLDPDLCQYTPTSGTDNAVWSVNTPATVFDAANYDFSEADPGIQAIRDGGFELMLRLGESYNGPNDTTQPGMWAAVAQRSYEHLATAWPDSLDVSGAPEWVEIHNEPDGFFWNGSIADYLTVYEQTYDAVKGVTAAGLVTPPVGGSGFTDGGVNAWLNGSTAFTIVTDFVNQVVASRLDFLSIHYYGNCAGTDLEELLDYLTAVRSTLDAAGGTGIPVLLTEWNIGLGSNCGSTFYEDPEVGSWVGAALTLMQDSGLGIGGAWYYDGAPLMGPFTMNASTQEFTVRPAAFAYRAHSQLADGTRIEAQTCNGAGASCESVPAAIADGDPVLPLAGTLPSGEHGVVLTNQSTTTQLVQVDFDAAGPPLAAVLIERPTAGVVTVPGVAASNVVTPTPAGMMTLGQSVTSTAGLVFADRSVQVELGPREVLYLRVSE